MSVFLFDGEYCEKRHDYDGDVQEIRGHLEAIEWATDIEEITESGLRRVVGHGPGMSLTTTNDLPDEKSEGSWSVAFTIATGDPLPLGH